MNKLYCVRIAQWDNDKGIVLRFYSENHVVLKIHNIILYCDDCKYYHHFAYLPMKLEESPKAIDIIPIEKHNYNKMTFTCTDDCGNHYDTRLLSNDFSEVVITSM